MFLSLTVPLFSSPPLFSHLLRTSSSPIPFRVCSRWRTPVPTRTALSSSLPQKKLLISTENMSCLGESSRSFFPLSLSLSLPFIPVCLFSQGMDVVRTIEYSATEAQDRPSEEVKIEDSGQLKPGEDDGVRVDADDPYPAFSVDFHPDKIDMLVRWKDGRAWICYLLSTPPLSRWVHVSLPSLSLLDHREDKCCRGDSRLRKQILPREEVRRSEGEVWKGKHRTFVKTCLSCLCGRLVFALLLFLSPSTGASVFAGRVSFRRRGEENPRGLRTLFSPLFPPPPHTHALVCAEPYSVLSQSRSV